MAFQGHLTLICNVFISHLEKVFKNTGVIIYIFPQRNLLPALENTFSSI